MSLLHFISKISEMDHKSSSLELFPRLNQYEVLNNKYVLITEPDIRALIIFQYSNSVFLFSSIFNFQAQT